MASLASRINNLKIDHGGNIKFPNVGGNRNETKNQSSGNYGYHGSKELEINRKRKDFIIKSKYQNQLPDIPCDPKHIVVSLDPYEFEPTTKELATFYDQLVDCDAGVPIDLVGSTLRWKLSSGNPPLDHPKDLFLLEDELTKDEEDQVKRSKSHKKRVTWLRRPEGYITSHPAKGGFKLAGNKAECRIEEAIQRKLKTDSNWKAFNTLYGKEDMVKFIEKTFEDAKEPILHHPTNPDIFPEQIIPIFPELFNA